MELPPPPLGHTAWSATAHVSHLLPLPPPSSQAPTASRSLLHPGPQPLSQEPHCPSASCSPVPLPLPPWSHTLPLYFSSLACRPDSSGCTASLAPSCRLSALPCSACACGQHGVDPRVLPERLGAVGTPCTHVRMATCGCLNNALPCMARYKAASGSDAVGLQDRTVSSFFSSPSRDSSRLATSKLRSFETSSTRVSRSFSRYSFSLSSAARYCWLSLCGIRRVRPVCSQGGAANASEGRGEGLRVWGRNAPPPHTLCLTGRCRRRRAQSPQH